MVAIPNGYLRKLSCCAQHARGAVVGSTNPSSAVALDPAVSALSAVPALSSLLIMLPGDMGDEAAASSMSE